MIDFMILCAPRSASTWCANWLTTDETLCLHDPLWTCHYSELDSIPTTKMLGVACTGLAIFGDWVNEHPARKVVLHRDINEINASLEGIGFPPLSEHWHTYLDNIQGMHCHWREVFDKPVRIYEHLLQRPFDADRHAMLCDVSMQPRFERIKVNREASARLLREMKAAAE